MTDLGLVIGLSSLITSVVLSLLAIGLAVAFYMQGSRADTRAQQALGEIRQQTEALQRLGSKMLDRLTRAATEGRPEHERQQMLLLIEAFRTVAPGPGVPQTQPTFTPEERAWLLQLLSCTYLYSAMTNVMSQELLPPSYTEVNPALQRVVDMSNADVVTLAGWLQPAADWPQEARSFHQWAEQWKPFVRDTLGAYQAREQAARETAPPTSE